MAKERKEGEVESGLKGCLDLTVPVIGDLATIEAGMETYNADKELVFLTPEDKRELSTLFLVKGGMSGLIKKAKEMEDQVKEVGSPYLLARGVKTVKVAGIGTLSLVEGGSSTISGDNLRKVLINYVSAEKVSEIVEKATKKTSYTTLQFAVEKVKK